MSKQPHIGYHGQTVAENQSIKRQLNIYRDFRLGLTWGQNVTAWNVLDIFILRRLAKMAKYLFHSVSPQGMFSKVTLILCLYQFFFLFNITDDLKMVDSILGWLFSWAFTHPSTSLPPWPPPFPKHHYAVFRFTARCVCSSIFVKSPMCHPQAPPIHCFEPAR